MKTIEILFNDPIEKTFRLALALPEGEKGGATNKKTIEKALRYLYAAAHGRTVETPIGPIRVAPATDLALNKTPVLVETRSDLLALAERRTPFRVSQERDDDSSQNETHSALIKFLGGELGAPESWPSPSLNPSQPMSEPRSLSLTH